jgi:hypothetical protein
VNRDNSALRKGVVTAELMAGGIDLMRQNLRRRHPSASKLEIEALLHAWLHREHEPVPGDVSGRVRVRSLSR